MLVATFRIGRKARVLREVPGPRRWLIKVFVTDGKERITNEVRNKQPALLSEILQTGIAAIDDLIKEMPEGTDAGWDVILLR